MRSLGRLQQRLLAVAACAMSAGALTTASGAETPPSLERRADRLQRATATITTRRNDALLSLYAFDAQLARAQERLTALRIEQTRVERELLSAQRRRDAALKTFRLSQRQLALRVHALYQRGGSDPLAVLLGASSIEDALAELENLTRTAQVNERVAEQAQRAHGRLRLLTRRLSQREAHLDELAAAAERTLRTLRAARDERGRFVAQLTRRQRLNASEIERVETRARALAEQSAAARPPALESATAGDPGIPSAARAVTVIATGYSISGSTVSGIPAGPGVVAVDPSVIPLGTRMTIPGYGEGVAADTGAGVRGAMIDLWFPTSRAARAWGRRTVTVTLD